MLKIYTKAGRSMRNPERTHIKNEQAIIKNRMAKIKKYQAEIRDSKSMIKVNKQIILNKKNIRMELGKENTTKNKFGQTIPKKKGKRSKLI